MKKIFRKILFGNIPVTEYCTITVDGVINEKVFLSAGRDTVDVSRTQWLLGLNPIVFGVWFKVLPEFISTEKNYAYVLQFEDGAPDSKTVAILKTVVRDYIHAPDGNLLLLELKRAVVHHIPYLKSLLLYYKYYKKPEQNYEKLKSYSAAYSYPRRVRLVSFREGDWFNIFPMDLVGEIPSSARFVFGLRHSNVTLSRIIETKKICVSEIPYDYKSIIYQLGKHHREALSESALPFEIMPSENFGFPIPVWVNRYKEIRIVRTLNLGSHMLLWGEVVNEKYISEPEGHLFHIHFLHHLHQRAAGLEYRMV
jgi:flavin reductase (DIM6/NTAB) family NADH-FMN oxidoreductase RutF